MKIKVDANALRDSKAAPQPEEDFMIYRLSLEKRAFVRFFSDAGEAVLSLDEGSWNLFDEERCVRAFMIEGSFIGQELRARWGLHSEYPYDIRNLATECPIVRACILTNNEDVFGGLVDMVRGLHNSHRRLEKELREAQLREGRYAKAPRMPFAKGFTEWRERLKDSVIDETGEWALSPVFVSIKVGTREYTSASTMDTHVLKSNLSAVDDICREFKNKMEFLKHVAFKRDSTYSYEDFCRWQALKEFPKETQ